MEFKDPFPSNERRYDVYGSFYVEVTAGLIRFEDDSAMLTRAAWKNNSCLRFGHDRATGVETRIGSDKHMPRVYLNGEKVPWSWLHPQYVPNAVGTNQSRRLCLDHYTGRVVCSFFDAKDAQDKKLRDQAQMAVPAHLLSSAAVYWPRPNVAPFGAPVMLHKPVPMTPNRRRWRQNLVAQAKAYVALRGTPPYHVYFGLEESQIQGETLAGLTEEHIHQLATHGFHGSIHERIHAPYLSLSKTES